MPQRQVYQEGFKQVAIPQDTGEAQAISRLGQQVSSVLIQRQDKQDELRISNYSSQADLEMMDATANYRTKNALNPTDRTANEGLQKEYDQIFDKYGKDLSISGKGLWAKNKAVLKQQYNSSNLKWALAQNVKNGETNLLEGVKAAHKKAFIMGTLGDFKAFQESSALKELQLRASVEGIVPADQIEDDMGNFASDDMKDFITGLIQRDPDEAEDMLNDEKIKETIDSPKAISDLDKLVKKRREEIMTISTEEQYKNYQDFDKNMGSMNVGEQLGALDQGILTGGMNKKWAEAKKQRIMSASGVNAETQNETFDKLGMRISDLAERYNAQKDVRGAREVLSGSISIASAIDKAVASGKLSTKSAKNLNNRLTSETLAKATEKVAGETSPWGWGMNNARTMFRDNLPDQTRVSEAVREYFEFTGGEEISYAVSSPGIPNMIKRRQQAVDLARSIVERYKQEDIVRAINRVEPAVEPNKEESAAINKLLDSLGVN